VSVGAGSLSRPPLSGHIVRQARMAIHDRITDGAFPIQRSPTIRATRITVGSVLTLVASGKNAVEIVALNPSLEVDDVQAAVEFLRLVLSSGSATKAAMTLGMRRRDLIAILEMVGISRPGATARPLVMELSTRTKQHIEALISPVSERAEAERLLAHLSPISSPGDRERVCFGALRISHGDLAKLAEVVRRDWRDILMEARFGSDVHGHETWVPRRLTPQDRRRWDNGGQIDGVLFRCGEPANLRRRGGVEGEPAVVLSLEALEPEPTYKVRSGRPGAEETVTAFQSWLEPLADGR
jgi:uncharacterized protein (DUF433 family)